MNIANSSYRDNDPILRADEEAVAFGPKAFNLTTGTLFTESGENHVPLSLIAAIEDFRGDGDFLLEGGDYLSKGRQQERLGELALQFLHGDQQPPISYFTSEGGSGAFMHILSYLKNDRTPFNQRQKIENASTMPVIITRPKWTNHIPILKAHDYTNIRQVSHLTQDQTTFNIEGVLNSLRKAKRAILLLQTQPHNPTGKNPTEEDWQALSTEVSRSGHVVILDSSFPGFSEGVVEDMAPSRILSGDGVEHFNAVSLSKICGIPGVRTGLASHVHGAHESQRRVDRDTQAIRNLASFQLRNTDTLGTYIISKALEKHPSLVQSDLEGIRRSFGVKTKKLTSLLPELNTQLQGTGQFRYFNGVSNKQANQLKEQGIFLAPVEKQKGSQGLRLNIGRLPLHRIDEFARKFRWIMIPQ